jgi:drug/metabolite transporter (DMT)-like permease
MFFTSLILIVFTGLPKISLKKLAQLAMCGALLGLHWMMFYGSIKASNVSIGVICYSLVGVFTAIFEPAILKRKFSWTEIAFSLITVLGLLCVFSFDSRYRYGILIGVGSAAISSIYSIFNKKYSKGIKSRTVLFYEMSAGLVIVTAIIPIYTTIFNIHQDIQVIPSGSNLWWMLCHALFCTVGLYLLQIQALRSLSAFTVNLTYNLEPCYTVLMAFIFFGEAKYVNLSFYIGIILILTSVLLQTRRAITQNKVKQLK